MCTQILLRIQKKTQQKLLEKNIDLKKTVHIYQSIEFPKKSTREINSTSAVVKNSISMNRTGVKLINGWNKDKQKKESKS